MKDFPKATVILRGYNYEETRTVMQALIQTNIRSVEITLNTKGALETIEKTSKEFSDQINIGAGTIKNLKDAKAAIKAGANFILTPIAISKEIIDECKENGITTVVGAMTPSEVWKCIEDGADIVKIFPAITCGSRYFNDIKGPLGDISLMAVGGVSSENAKEFLDNGADFLGIGSGLFKKSDVEARNIDALVKSIKELEKQIF